MPASNSRLRVLLLARELGAGGSERQLTELAKAIDKNRFEVHVGYFREGIRLADLSGTDVLTLKLDVTSFHEFGTLKQAQILSRYLRLHSIQAVHTFDYPLTCFAVPIAKAVGVPIILSSQRGSRSLIPAVYRHAVRATDELVTGVVVNCRAMERSLTEEEGLPHRKVHLCYNGIDASRYAPEPFANAAHRPITIGSVAVLRPEKNLSLLIKTFARLAASSPAERLLIVGSGPEEERLRAVGKEWGIESRCEFRATQADVTTALRDMDIFVLPSLTEAFSNSLMEAMASGCAVIASKVGGNPELVEHERTGLLFESDNLTDLTRQIRRLISDNALGTRLGKQAREFIATHFSIETAARRLEQIYDRLAARTPR